MPVAGAGAPAAGGDPERRDRPVRRAAIPVEGGRVAVARGTRGTWGRCRARVPWTCGPWGFGIAPRGARISETRRLHRAGGGRRGLRRGPPVRAVARLPPRGRADLRADPLPLDPGGIASRPGG